MNLEVEMQEENETQKPQKADNTLLMVFLTIALLGFGGFIMKKMIATKPEAKKGTVESWQPSVKVIVAKRQNYTPIIRSEGSVSASTKTMLVSEVTGAVTYISSLLEKGNVIPKGEVLIKVDETDYKTQLTNAMSNLADAELLLAQEEARAQQAMREWSKLGRGGEASDMIMRKPQIKSAKARIESAQSMIDKVNRDVSKTVIRAPYTCIVDEKMVSPGAFVSAMSQIAEISAIDQYQVRLPLNLNELSFLGESSGLGSEVQLEAVIGGMKYQWKGKILRFEGGVDSSTFSRIMVVQVLRDEVQSKGFELPPVGLFLKASIVGSSMEEVLSVPRGAIREGNTLWLLSKENTLRIEDVDLLRTERENVIIDAESIHDGDRIITSPIAIPVNGMQLELENSEAENK